MPASCVVFEDQFTDHLRPINLARPTCAVTCGAYCLENLIPDLNLPTYFHVRPHLRPILERDNKPAPRELPGPVLFLNAGLLPDLKTIRRLRELIAANQPFLALNDQRVTAAWISAGFPPQLADRNHNEIIAHILDSRLQPIDDEFPMLEHTFDIMRYHEKLLPSHLAHLVERGKYRQLAENVFVGEGGEIASNVVFDASDGPIVIGNNVRIKPFSYVAGPVKIGDKSLIIDHASIKHGTVLGHTVKAGGELEAAIIEPYSNKQHHGFIGHAYVGSWCNLGAGTSNSDLKNTYGDISVDVDGHSRDTGLQFLGCVIGDYTKTAINTSIFTGKLVGVASFLYGFISTNVPSFTNYARSFGQVTEVPIDVAIKTQNRAAKRRNIAVTTADAQLMHDMFDLTRTERQLSSERVVL